VTDSRSNDAASRLLDAVVVEAGGERREGQRQLCEAIAVALDRGRHLAAEAPTGVGKSFALAAAAVAHLHARTEGDDDDERVRIVIATATKALQDQLVDLDLPRVAAVAERLGMPTTFAVLKGRSNYLCLAAADEAGGSLFDREREAALEFPAAARKAGTGERNRLSHVDDSVWSQLSVTRGECPGARNCSHGQECWAERARWTANDADIIVVNQALYASHLLADEAVLPDHVALIVDEAHALADNIVDAGAVTLSAARLDQLTVRGRRWLGDDRVAELNRSTKELAAVLGRSEDGTVEATAGDLGVAVAAAKAAAAAAAVDLKAETSDDALRVLHLAIGLEFDLDKVGTATDEQVSWVSGGSRLHSSPIEARETAAQVLWPDRTVIATSATLQGSRARPFEMFLGALGAPSDVDVLAVPAPFDYRRQALLYVPRDRLPSPKHDDWREAVRRELWELVGAAGGRTLALFTSKSAAEDAAVFLRDAAEASGTTLDVLTQWDGPRDHVVGRLLAEPATVVCATRSFWSGVDIPGDACVLVTIDRLPFPRPDDPLVQARRRRATQRRESSFEAVDLPYAATHLAQGVGRLIRSPADLGVVAVLDTRLATANWRRAILDALPPLRRTVDIDEVRAFLARAVASSGPRTPA
jgi:ATP-dependent DNA helicase DinG